MQHKLNEINLFVMLVPQLHIPVSPGDKIIEHIVRKEPQLSSVRAAFHRTYQWFLWKN